MSSTIDYFFPKLKNNPIMKFQYISERIIKIRSEFDMLAGLFFAYLEKIYQLEDSISMRQLKINCYLAVDLIKKKESIKNKLESTIAGFSKKAITIVDNIEYLMSYSSFLKKYDQITEIKNENKEIFALIPRIIIVANLIRMIKREQIQKYKKYLEEVLNVIVEKRECIPSSEKFSEFLKMMFANIFEVKLNFYNATDFVEKENVKKEKVSSFLPLNFDNHKKSIHILFVEKGMHSLWKNDIQVYIEARLIIDKSFDEGKPIQTLFEKINRERKKYLRENGIYHSITKKLLHVTEKMLPDFSLKNLQQDDVLNAFRSVKKYIKQNKGMFSQEIQDKINRIRDKINNNLTETDNSETVISIDEQNEMKNVEYDSQMNREEIEKPPPPPPIMIFCPICEEEKPLTEIKTFDCDHRICQDCAYGFLNAKYESGDWTFDIPCFNGNCQNEYALKHPESYYFLKDILGDAKVEKMCHKLATDTINFKCANKKCKFNCEIDVSDNSKFFICQECDTQTCLKCKEVRHDGKVCSALLGKMLLALGNTMENRLRVCPFCFEPYLKDQHCEHVSCLKCKNDWCFTCSVDRIPTLAHGNHYHRRDCKQFHPWTDINNAEILVEEFDPKKCERCRKNNVPCKRPATMNEFYDQIGFPLPEQPEAQEKKVQEG